MKVLFDTNVILDVLFDRRPFSDAGIRLFSEVERERIRACLCATSVTAIHYLAAKVVGLQAAEAHIRKVLSIFDVATVNRGVLDAALEIGFQDFEDGVTHQAARLYGAEMIVTRNPRDFRRSVIPVLSPVELLELISKRGETGN